ncbi:DNA-binding CsgD family transcriptional regulator [Edaphobacter lichenicola]|uniref:DNA-binding CsgD family transcriptional regulator n=1 Tax=Tunturiibacter gelidiferens TaxID=3069689 RepID=A0A9X0U646_9BACT|nr:DNA-binding CsgD family transcriptional regulator [Edaphobacter lichenicola]
MRTSVFYNEFLSKQGICEVACVSAIASTKAFEVLSIYRGPNEGPIDREQLAMLRIVAPHLRTALATKHKLQALQRRACDLESAFDRLPTALVLVNLKGRPVLVNAAARAICDKRDGLVLSHSEVAAQKPSENSRLRAAILLAIRAVTEKTHPSVAGLVISRNRGRPLQISVVPLISRDADVPQEAVATIFISDPDCHDGAAPSVLREMYRLSHAETRLAILLLEGKSLREAADLLEIGWETVRTQVKSLFHKTGTKRQGELVRLLDAC